LIPDSEVIPTANRKCEFKVAVTYGNCNAVPNYTQTGNCAGAPNYTVSGWVRTQLESNTTALYGCGSGVCDYMLGENSTACCFDCPVANLAFKTSASSFRSGESIEVNVTAKYMDGTPAANATMVFSANATLGNVFTPANRLTNETGGITVNYKGTMFPPPPLGGSPVVIVASTCGKKANVTVTVLP
jgi:hypothetical protein